ncbi:hypothetical protein M885DRAFT_615591 [Pelagophyceae sp. CCMP2097]|nr:hypothetical protein M885DRAFT_615591 [Pelagophyceae sp. CCMP2097]
MTPRLRLALTLAAALLAPAQPQAAPCSPLTGGVCAVELGTAGDFAILGKSGISTVPESDITGDIGVSPIAATAMTGFSLALDSSGQFSTSSQVDGECYAADYAAPTPEKMRKAVGDMEFAYADAASRKTTDPTKNNVGGGTIGGMTLTPGVYSWTVNVQFATDLTLTGGPTDVFILKTTGVIFAGAGVRVVLAGGVMAKNVFWQAAGNVAIGADAHVEGIFLVKTDVVLITGSSINGRLLAQTAVNLQKAIIHEPPMTVEEALVLAKETDARIAAKGILAPPCSPVTVGGACGVDLRSAGDFAILGKSGISSVPTSDVTGDIGVSPIAATAMTGFTLVLDSSGQFSKSTQVDGECYAADYATPTPEKMTKAIGDMEFAYTDAQSRQTTPGNKNVGGGTIGGMTLTPGVYTWTVNVQFAEDLTLTGGPTDVFILQTTGVLFASAGVRVVLLGGVQAKNVYWQVAGNVAIGAEAHVEGIFLVKTDVVLITGASINGRLLAQTAVTLQSATVTAPTVGPRLAAATAASAETGSSYPADDDDDDDDDHKTIFGMLVAILAVLALLVVLHVASLVQGCSARKSARGGSKGGGGPAKADSDDAPQSPMH